MMNFLSHSLQMEPRSGGASFLLPFKLVVEFGRRYLRAQNFLVFFMQFLQFDIPQKWQWLSLRSVAFFHFS